MPNDFRYCPDGVQLENNHVNQILLQLTGKLAQGVPITIRGSSGQALLTIDDTGVKVSRNGVEVPTDPYVPIGGAIIWTRPVGEIPAGWAICDGLNGTPDYRDRFPLGVGGIAAQGGTGGAQTVNLSHSHPFTATHVHTLNAHVHGMQNHTHSIATATGQTLGDGSFSSTDRVGTGTPFDNNDTGHTHGLNHAHGGATGTPSNNNTNSNSDNTTAVTPGTSDLAGSTTQTVMPPYIGVIFIRRQV